MIDINFIKQNPGILDKALKNRNKQLVEDRLLELDEKSRALQTKLQKVQEERNANSAAFGKAKSSGGDVSEIQIRMEKLKKEMAELTESANTSKLEFLNLLYTIPNIPSDDCPIGLDENDNIEVRRFGTPRTFDFKPLEHYEIGTKLGMMDFDRSAKIAGSRFVFLFSEVAKLERALAQFMLDVHTNENGYTEVYVPLILEQKECLVSVNCQNLKKTYLKRLLELI